MAARMAEKYGYTNIKVYHAGVPAWSQAGNLLLTTHDFVSKRLGYIVTIDTRGLTTLSFALAGSRTTNKDRAASRS